VGERLNLAWVRRKKGGPRWGGGIIDGGDKLTLAVGATKEEEKKNEVNCRQTGQIVTGLRGGGVF